MQIVKIIEFLFWLNVLCIMMSWVLYPVALFIMVRLKKITAIDNDYSDEIQKPFISFIIAAYNEEQNIKKRIENLRSISRSWSFEIIIASDGSTDNTVENVRALGYPELRVIEFEKNRGRATVHNDCSNLAKGDVLLFTDAETVFASDFLEFIMPYFGDHDVGAVSGRILYLNQDSSEIGRSAGIYWRFEEFIRTSESKLGILGFGTGAALAIRKTAYKAIGPTEDIDYAATLAVCAKNFQVKYEPMAKAYDYISETTSGAFSTRIRQTSRCFKSVINRIFTPPILIRRPKVMLAAIMHKTFRHITPFFMLVLFFSNLTLLFTGLFYIFSFVLQALFYIAAIIGWLCKDNKILPFRILFSLPYNFFLLNVSRAVGVCIALLRLERATYRTSR